ncbi:hypothetical protein OESDEN_04520 [Oesophagostomum dentatum]|uniref:Uncharacterized protein n=1 Tax=Oesophagostomum dentatum TaxID=61180 RepID=A0A0B1TDB0_OESDE|nr:hypothetical protein OESDEN_04520 [Oesophagostomum dentatum]
MRHLGLVVTDTQVADPVICNYVIEFIPNEEGEYKHDLVQVGQSAFRFEPNGVFDPVFVKNQKMRHLGLVVTDTQVADPVICNYVIEFIPNENGEYGRELVQVGQSAFRFEPNGVFDPVFVKNQKRRLERPLSFGDIIEWEDADVLNKIISRIHRSVNLFEARIYDGRSQILVTGVVSPTNKFWFWSEYFADITIDNESANDALPNISLSAWLNIAVDADGRLQIEFDSFESVECEGNIVAKAPWNRNQSKYTTLAIPMNDDGIETQIEEPEANEYKGGWKQELRNYEGICTGGRLLYCKELPSYEIVVALFKEVKECVKLETGVSCEFDATWNEFEKRFIVIRYRTKGRVLRLAADGLMRTTVKAEEDYPCVFNSEELGLIDDPDGVLSLLHLSPYQRSSVVVSLHDSPSISSRFRFRIADVQPDKGPKLKKWMAENEIVVRDAKGVVVDKCTVYSKDHGSIFFVIPDTLRSDVSPGKIVKFSAQYQRDDKIFMVSQMSVLPNEVPAAEKKMLRLPHEQQWVFRVTAKKVRRKQLDFLMECDEFGLLDVGSRAFLTNKGTPRIVWVMRSVPDIDQTERPSRTPFQIVWVGEREPITANTEEELKSEEEEKAPEPNESVASKINAISMEDAIEAARERMGVDSKPHNVECTDQECAPGCPHMEMLMLMVETVPKFLETLSEVDRVLYTKLVNKIFE